MFCMKCGAPLSDSAYCPACGCDVSVQKQAIVLSGLYYNQGLEKAQIRDLSGAIDQLRRSLKFNKLNIEARNLLGLVYFETGEVVAALSEWVISKNFQPEENLASYYISNLQKDASRLEVINRTIKKFNIALKNCREGHEDVAKIQLQKLLGENPKLIKGYHLLALLYLREEEYERARKLLLRALRIDRTNTTTLRYIREVDEMTHKTTSLDQHRDLIPLPGRERKGEVQLLPISDEGTVELPPYRETPVSATVLSAIAGLLLGAALVALLVLPAATSAKVREFNKEKLALTQEIAALNEQAAELQGEIDGQKNTVDTAEEKISEANGKADSYVQLASAAVAYGDEEYNLAAARLIEIDPEVLSEEARAVYDEMAAELEEEMYAALVDTGVTAFDAAEYERAVHYLEKAKAVEEEDYVVLNHLAHSYRYLGDANRADENFRKIIETWPDSEWAAAASQYLGTKQAQEGTIPSENLVTVPAEGSV